MSGSTQRRGSTVRGSIGIFLAIIAALITWMSVDGAWLHERVFDTDAFVESLEPLPQEPAVSMAIALRTTEALGRNLEVEARVAEALPDRLAFLAPKFVGFVGDYVYDLAIKIIESDAFANVWRVGLERVHATTIGILEGDVATTETGNVGISLDGLAGLVLDRLEERDLDLFEHVEISMGEIVFIQAETLARPRALVNVFHTSALALPVVALALLFLAVIIDWDHLRAVQIWGYWTALITLLGLGAIRLSTNMVGDSIESEVDRAAARVIWDALLDGYLRISAIVGLTAFTIGFAAWGLRRVHRMKTARAMAP
ncbi:MAG: hypothetical protein ABFR89_08980 [Actinomycetota bacterium]